MGTKYSNFNKEIYQPIKQIVIGKKIPGIFNGMIQQCHQEPRFFSSFHSATLLCWICSHAIVPMVTVGLSQSRHHSQAWHFQSEKRSALCLMSLIKKPFSDATLLTCLFISLAKIVFPALPYFISYQLTRDMKPWLACSFR